MAYLVLGLGIVMAVLGGAAIANGYPIIQVERGWAGVIAGAALLAGGVVTFSLGIVVRSLASVRDALFAGAASPAYARAPAEPAFAGATARMAMPAAPQPTPATAAAVGLGAIGAAALGHEAPVYQTDLETAASAHDPEPIAHDHEPVQDGGGYPQAGHPGAHPATDIADGYALETPSTPQHDLPLSAGAPPGDWLDRAFSELDLHVPEHAPPQEAPHPPRTPAEALEPETVPPTPAYQPAPAEPGHPRTEHVAEPQPAEPELAEHPVAESAEFVDHAPEPAAIEHADHTPVEHVEDAAYREAALAPVADVLEADRYPAAEPSPHRREDPVAAAAPVGAEPSSPVIGRYEADGTSYTMYADGAIEAQSSAGVYRFASMAELKAFIEG